MKNILITQLRDTIDNRDEIRDCLDVRWAKILYNLNLMPLPICSELVGELDYISKLQPDGILLTGGNDIGEAPKRDKLERELLDYAKLHNIPVLGVCRGMQFMNCYLGGSLINVEGHVATYSELNGVWPKKRGYQQVNSYHNQAIVDKTLAISLESLATTSDGVVKAVKHSTLPWVGIMWHPERECKLHKADERLLTAHFSKKRV